MLATRRLILGLLALFLLAGVTPASADDGKTTEKTRFQEPVTFTLKAGPEGCNLIPNDLSGTGTADNTIKTVTFYTGSRQIFDDREVNGQVVDSTGKSRRFQYIHHAVLTQSADRLSVHVDFTDTFIIKDKGKKNHLEVRFHWFWTYTPDDPSVLPTAENIAFPPVDNWVRLEEVGEPLTCDPL